MLDVLRAVRACRPTRDSGGAHEAGALIVDGKGCPVATEQGIAALGDERGHFVKVAHRADGDCNLVQRLEGMRIRLGSAVIVPRGSSA